MQTTHAVVEADARSLSTVDDDAVELVVTSPPYPMIELWDETFAELDPRIGDRLADGDGEAAFSLMHDCLDTVWAEVERVLVDGGIVCVNVGDATRTIDGEFQLYPNHVRVTEAFLDRGFRALPPIHWHKPTNRGTKFMGSGMLPPNAYVTLEHERILIFRAGEPRSFPPGDEQRYESAYFWEERNRWFSDRWTLSGERQSLDAETRNRSGAFPLALPYRLLSMYSVYGDTVLDPFLGTGTTTLAAMATGRNSIGYEVQSELIESFRNRLDGLPDRTQELIDDRLGAHRDFVADREAADDPPAHTNDPYDLPVVTAQETSLRFYAPTGIDEGDDSITVTHEPYP